MSTAELYVSFQGEAVPIPESGMILTIVELAPGTSVAALEAPTPPLKHSSELMQITALGAGSRGAIRTGIVWLVRRIDE